MADFFRAQHKHLQNLAKQPFITSADFAEIMLVFLRKVCFDSVDKGGVEYVYLRMQGLA